MKRIIFTFLTWAAIAGLAIAGDIPSPQARAVIVNKAKARIEPRIFEHAEILPSLNNPFAPRAAAEVKTGEPVVQQRIATGDLVNILAGQLNPTGVLVMGGEPLLTFGEKKMKVGDVLDIAFDNGTYQVELVAVTRSTFSIRYNQHVATRSIKPGKNP